MWADALCEEDTSFYRVGTAAPVSAAAAVSTSHWAPLGCRTQHRRALAPVMITVMQKALNNDRHPTCIITHTV